MTGLATNQPHRSCSATRDFQVLFQANTEAVSEAEMYPVRHVSERAYWLIANPAIGFHAS